MKDRYLVEIGRGVDMHGGDVTKACIRAVKDAISHCCMCGVRELLGGPAIWLTVRLGCSRPEEVDLERVRQTLPYKRVELEAVPGGLSAAGIYVPEHGEGSAIEVALAAITVHLEPKEGGGKQ